jgi:hypothetical protein
VPIHFEWKVETLRAYISIRFSAPSYPFSHKSLIRGTLNGNLTSILTGHVWTLRPEAKTAIQLNAVLFMSIHNFEKMLQGYHKVPCDGRLAYVAHTKMAATRVCSKAKRLEPMSGVLSIVLLAVYHCVVVGCGPHVVLASHS